MPPPPRLVGGYSLARGGCRRDPTGLDHVPYVSRARLDRRTCEFPSGGSPQAGDEARPLVPADGQHWSVRVVGVRDGDDAGQAGRDLHAVTAAVTAVAGLVPARAYGFHRSSATFRMRFREASRGSASPRTRSNATAAFRTSDRFSVVWSSTPSMRRVSAMPSAAAMSNAPASPAFAPFPAGTTCTTM